MGKTTNVKIKAKKLYTFLLKRVKKEKNKSCDGGDFLSFIGQPFIEIKPKNSFQKLLNKIRNKIGFKNRVEMNPNLRYVKNLMYRIECITTKPLLQKEIENLKTNFQLWDFSAQQLKNRIRLIEEKIEEINKLNH